MIIYRVSAHITLKEATKSVTASRLGILNQPSKMELEAMKCVAEKSFEPCREGLGGKAIGISSFYRCVKLNRALGSSDRSFHVFGFAIDLDADIYGHHTNKQIFDFFYSGKAPYTELVWEYGTEQEPDWVHVAYNPADKRRMVKRAYVDKGRKLVKTFDLY